MNGNQNEENIFKGCMRRMELGKLANEGNRFAQHQQNVDKTGLRVNFEALMKEPCSHTRVFPNGRRFRVDSWCEPMTLGEFKIQERFCTLCGKTLETRIWKPNPFVSPFARLFTEDWNVKKPKRPRRGF